MKRRSKWILTAGILLLAISLCLLVLPQVMHYYGARHAADTVARIEAALPNRIAGAPDSYRVMQMPTLEVDGEDYIGLLEISAHSVILPIGNDWQAAQLYRHPCRFDGTAYDGSLIIGGGSRQMACLKQMQNGDKVTVTDMHGAIFTYTVTRIRRADRADGDTLRSTAALTLFARDANNMDYVIVECE